MSYLVLVRHGQSVWNKENRFTGLTDIDLSPEGVAESHHAATQIKQIRFEAAFSSPLKRAHHTLQIILEDLGQSDLAITTDPALDERDYGELTGKNKDAIKQRYGEDQLQRWRRGWDEAPPGGESLRQTYLRTFPYVRTHIFPLFQEERDVILCAHGNSLRAIIKELDHISEDAIPFLEVPTGTAVIYEVSANLVFKKMPDPRSA